jgi:hypothetical protein
MRRLIGLVLPALLALLLLAVPAAASDGEAGALGADDGADLLAAEAEEGEEGEEDAGGGDAGPDPMPRDAEDNPATELGGYGDLDTPFTWGAAFIMLFLGVVGLVAMGGLYWLLVHRPRQKETAGAR